MRIIRMILGAAFLLSVIGCGNEQVTAVPAQSNSALASGAHPQNAVGSADQVVVSRSLRFGRVNAAPFGIFTEKEQVDVFGKALQSADKIPGILDVVQPDYDVVIEQAGKRWEIHLWLDDRSAHGMYMYVSDTNTGYNLTEESTRQLYNLIWGLRYEPKQAVANGDFVNLHGKLSNLDVWEKFVANVKAGVQDEVQVVQYTVEGGPIFDNLSFDGNTITHKYDNTHDTFGTPTKRFDFCKSIEQTKSDSGTEYNLASCGEGGTGIGLLHIPADEE